MTNYHMIVYYDQDHQPVHVRKRAGMFEDLAMALYVPTLCFSDKNLSTAEVLNFTHHRTARDFSYDVVKKMITKDKNLETQHVHAYTYYRENNLAYTVPLCKPSDTFLEEYQNGQISLDTLIEIFDRWSDAEVTITERLHRLSCGPNDHVQEYYTLEEVRQITLLTYIDAINEWHHLNYFGLQNAILRNEKNRTEFLEELDSFINRTDPGCDSFDYHPVVRLFELDSGADSLPWEDDEEDYDDVEEWSDVPSDPHDMSRRVVLSMTKELQKIVDAAGELIKALDEL